MHQILSWIYATLDVPRRWLHKPRVEIKENIWWRISRNAWRIISASILIQSRSQIFQTELSYVFDISAHLGLFKHLCSSIWCTSDVFRNHTPVHFDIKYTEKHTKKVLNNEHVIVFKADLRCRFTRATHTNSRTSPRSQDYPKNIEFLIQYVFFVWVVGCGHVNAFRIDQISRRLFRPKIWSHTYAMVL